MKATPVPGRSDGQNAGRAQGGDPPLQRASPQFRIAGEIALIAERDRHHPDGEPRVMIENPLERCRQNIAIAQDPAPVGHFDGHDPDGGSNAEDRRRDGVAMAAPVAHIVDGALVGKVDSWQNGKIPARTGIDHRHGECWSLVGFRRHPIIVAQDRPVEP